METPILSTMVVLYKTNLMFDTNILLNELPIDDQIIKVEKRGVLKRGESKRDKIKRRSKKDTPTNNTGFCHNSITLVMLNDGDGTLPKKEITIKIFQNGVLHMTGVLDDKYDQSSVRILMNVLHDTCYSAIKNPPETFEIMNRRVVLMNYTTKFTAEGTVAREALHNNIRALDDENFTSNYDPDVYPGVKINIGKGNWTAKVFRTGKIILTGITHHDECKELISQLLGLFEKALPQKQRSESTSSKAVLR